MVCPQDPLHRGAVCQEAEAEQADPSGDLDGKLQHDLIQHQVLAM
jgi:hypothetical protein